jgi:hypothetical protein
VTLTANCSNNVGSISYTWTASGANAAGCPSVGSGASQTNNLAVPTATSAVNCTYNLSANDTATTATTSKTVSYSAGGSGGGGGGGGTVDTSVCAALGLNAKVVVATWTGNTILYTASSPVNGFGPNDAVIVQFTTSSVTTSTNKGNISAVEYMGPTTPRAGALSASPCDFTVGMPKYKLKSGVVTQCATTVISGATSPSTGFSLVAQPQSSLDCQAVLQPNTTYYWNLTNFVPAPPTGTQQCSQSLCNMQITLTKPAGT